MLLIVIQSLCYKRNGRFIKLSLEMNEDKCRIVTQSTETPSKIHSVLKLLKMSHYAKIMKLK